MRVAGLNWMQVEEQIGRDDRAVLPIGSTEQHAYLSLATDAILAERIAADAAEPLGVPVFPVMAYGITPTFMAYPGTISLRVETLCAFIRDALDSLHAHGFRRVLVVNGHGGNAPAQSAVYEWLGAHADTKVKWHNWWNSPRVLAQVKATDPLASHASWMENFPWTRLAGVIVPERHKPSTPRTSDDPQQVRKAAGDGSFGGWYSRPDEDVMRVWRTGVEETREVLADL